MANRDEPQLRKKRAAKEKRRSAGSCYSSKSVRIREAERSSAATVVTHTAPKKGKK